MSHISYVNGNYQFHNKAKLHIEDRATQFSDGVYEVIAVINGNLIDSELHYKRLSRSLSELKIKPPTTTRGLHLIIKEVIRLNRLHTGLCYLQISRGVAPRNHSFPSESRASIVITTKYFQPAGGRLADRGVPVITVEDLRWKRRDIKSVSLLPNVLAKEKAVQDHAFEAWFVDVQDNNVVIEGSSSNAWIVSQNGSLVTHPEGVKMLSGVTRNRIITLARTNGLQVEEEPFTLDQAKQASEAFLTSTSSFVIPVVTIDGFDVGHGKPGPVTKRVAKLYNDFVNKPSLDFS